MKSYRNDGQAMSGLFLTSGIASVVQKGHHVPARTISLVSALRTLRNMYRGLITLNDSVTPPR